MILTHLGYHHDELNIKSGESIHKIDYVIRKYIEIRQRKNGVPVQFNALTLERGYDGAGSSSCNTCNCTNPSALLNIQNWVLFKRLKPPPILSAWQFRPASVSCFRQFRSVHICRHRDKAKHCNNCHRFVCLRIFGSCSLRFLSAYRPMRVLVRAQYHMFNLLVSPRSKPVS